MAGLKITLDAALRARDVSRPSAAQEAEAERALPDRLASRRSAPGPQAAAGDGDGPQPRIGTGPRPATRYSDTPPRPGPRQDAAGTRDPVRPAADPEDGAVTARDNLPEHQARVRRRHRLGGSAGHGSGGSSPDFS